MENSVTSKQSSHSCSQQITHLSSMSGSLAGLYLIPFSLSRMRAASLQPVSLENLGLSSLLGSWQVGARVFWPRVTSRAEMGDILTEKRLLQLTSVGWV